MPSPTASTLTVSAPAQPDISVPSRMPTETRQGDLSGPSRPPRRKPRRRRKDTPARENGQESQVSSNGTREPRGRRRKPAPPRERLNGDTAPPRERTVASPRVDLQAEPFPRDREFGAIAVSEPIRHALDDMGFESPTPIQAQAVPAMLDGKDVVGRAQTGTGKTTAFGIPMIELLDPTRPDVQGLVLAPTRELAVQVAGELRRLARHRGTRVVTLYGGQKIDIQLAALKDTPQIIVGTPGRVQDHMQRGTLKLNAVRIAVLDEADQMLDIGFAEDMIRILRATPRARQTALFSATVPSFIKRMIERFLCDPIHIGIGEESEAAETIEQVYYEVASEDKLNGLQEVIKTELEGEKTLIFCRTQVGVDRLARRLQRVKIRVEPIHGGMRQNQREAVMRAFRSGELKVLVATNVAARGLDIPEISHVINYDMPGNLEEYIHRIGRTGRIGNAGKAVTFVSEDDFEMLQTVKKHVGDNLSKGRLNLYA